MDAACNELLNIHCSTVPSWMTSIPRICNLVDGSQRSFSSTECPLPLPDGTPARLHKNPGVLKRVISNRACLWEHRAVPYICLARRAQHSPRFHRRSAAASFINKYRFLTVGLGQRAGGYCHGDGMTPRADCRICAYHPICSSAIPPQYILRVVFLRRRSEESRKTIHGRRYVCLLGRQITIQQGHSLFYASALDRFMYGQLVETRYVCMGMTGCV